MPQNKVVENTTPQSERYNIEMTHLRQRMAKIKHKIAIISGKGGVGKTLVTVNLATALSVKGNKVGVLDADIHGPCVPRMLGLKRQQLDVGPAGIFPAINSIGLKVISMDMLLPSDDAPVIWRGPLKMGAIRQFLGEVAWGDLDYLLIDLPPGTGDEPLSILQLLPDIDGVIIVTIPSRVSQDVVKKAVTFARNLNAPILGIVENMSVLICPHCNQEIKIFGESQKVAEEMEVQTLGSIPFDPDVSSDSDSGTPFIIEHPESGSSEAFMKIVEKIEKMMEEKKN